MFGDARKSETFGPMCGSYSQKKKLKTLFLRRGKASAFFPLFQWLELVSLITIGSKHSLQLTEEIKKYQQIFCFIHFDATNSNENIF
jgi:hypothetical protein